MGYNLHHGNAGHKMHSISIWKLARRPNYDTNIDFQFPYSEVPYLGDYDLVKIPLSVNTLIQHVDYWGEGKIVTKDGISGFSNCYNVNHPYQLVSNGSDRDRKIPNRIPVESYTNCDTSSYIKDSTVLNVTIMGAPINTSCAKDIARIVNNDMGKVVAYGFEESDDIRNLTQELKKKGLFHCPNYELPNNLKGRTLFDDYMAFLNVSEVKDILYDKIINSDYDVAVELTKLLSSNDEHKHVINDIVVKLLNNNKRNIMPYAYKLWHSGAQNVVSENFPTPFKLIFNQDAITIVNKGYNQALKLDVHTDRYNDRLAWGDKQDKTSDRVSWKIIPVWNNNNVTFKLYNIDCNMYLKLDVTPDGIGDREAWGSTNSNEVRHRYYLEPMLKNNELLFLIIDCQYHQGLKLAVNVDTYGDRLLWGNNGSPYNNEERFRWIFAAW